MLCVLFHTKNVDKLLPGFKCIIAMFSCLFSTISNINSLFSDYLVYYNNVGIYIQYWCIDGKVRWGGLETGKRLTFSESFQPFRAEPHTFYICRQYTNN